MTTSIDDLLNVLDTETSDEQQRDPLDAARALHHSARTLNLVLEHGIGSDAPPYARAAVRRLAESCADVACAFEQRNGRISDLVGVLGDTVDTMHNELAGADCWAVAARLAPIARRCAAVITASGPYVTVPELLSVADRAGDVQHAVLSNPPKLRELNGLDAPIPSTVHEAGRSHDAVILEATAGLVAAFRSRERPLATQRELVAVCHIGARVAERFSMAEAGCDGTRDRWIAARDTLRSFSDGVPLPPPRAPRSRILLIAMRLEIAIRHAEAVQTLAATNEPCSPQASQQQDRALAARHLDRLADVCSRELMRIQPTLSVLPGPHPITEERAGEWLRKQTFRAQLPDLLPAMTALRSTRTLGASRSCVPEPVAL